LKSLLCNNSNQATWQNTAHALYAMNVSYKHKKIDNNTKMNMFLQSWNVTTKQNTSLSQDLIQIVKQAKEYNLKIDARTLTNEGKGKMPLWYHNASSAKTNRITNSKQGKCLRENHKIYTVEDAINITANQPNNHKTSGKKCKCNKCKAERCKGCANPAKCLLIVKKLLNELPTHWRPQNDDGYESEETLDKESQESNDNPIKTFEYKLPTSNKIHNALRIFTTTEDNLKDVSIPRKTRNNIMTVYTNGVCKMNRDINAQAGSGIWINKDNIINKACRVPGLNQNTETGELYAAEYTACKIP
ncbi:hypothetical protein ARMGADRAFT_856811, partial [Armillaria gallica]